MVRDKLSTWEHCSLASLWFAYNVQWSALIPVVWPAQVAAIVGEAHKELVNGIVVAVAATMALVTTPIAGALSDRSTNPRGRRRGFLVNGIALNVVALCTLAAVGARGGVSRFLVALIALEFACNWWGGPYAGMVPDVVSASEQGRASGYMMLMTVAGAIVGTGIAGPLLSWGGYRTVYLFLILVLLFCGVITLAGTRQIQREPGNRPLDGKAWFQNFLPKPGLHPDFYIVFVTRAFVTMGAFSALPFFQYFFADVMHDDRAILHESALLGTTALLTLPIALLVGKRADRQGPVTIVWISGWVMAGAATLYIIDCFVPSWTFTIVMCLIFASGSIAYQTVDWALVLRVLPDARHAAKDMGIWHVAFVLPQAIAPLISGTLLNSIKKFSKPAAYAAVLAMTGIWYALGTVPIRKLRLGNSSFAR
jgi:MFS family permease